MLEKVKERLLSLGITLSNDPSSTDGFLLSFAVKKVTDHINNQTNLDSIPHGLESVAIDMAVGEFLFAKKSMGLLDVSSLDFSAAVKKVQDGDTNVEYAIESKDTPEAKFEKFILYLQHNETDFVRYRVLTW